VEAKRGFLLHTGPAQRNRWKGLLGLGLILIVGALAMRLTAEHNNLLLRATRIRKADPLALRDYQWLDAGTLLSFGVAERERSGSSIATRVDLRTGAATPIEALNQRIGAQRLRAAGENYPSPDGRQLLFLWSKRHHINCSVAALDGSHIADASLRNVPNGIGANLRTVAWLPDSHHWCYTIGWGAPGAATLTLYSVDSAQPERAVRVKLPPNISLSGLLGFDAAGRAIAVGIAQPRWTRTVTLTPVTVTQGTPVAMRVGTPVAGTPVGVYGRAPTVVTKGRKNSTAGSTSHSATTATPSGILASAPSILRGAGVYGAGMGMPSRTIVPVKYVRAGKAIPTVTTGYGATQPTAWDQLQKQPGVSMLSASMSGSQQGNISTQTNATYFKRGNAYFHLTETIKTAPDPDEKGLHLLILPLEPNSVARDCPVTLPADARPTSLALSPQGDRLALALLFTRPLLVYPLSRWLNQQPIPQDAFAIWTCRVDGSDLHPIGPELSYHGGQAPPTALRWLPDGKEVSFLCNSALYTLPAD
jgi:hypothetical protein